MIKFNKLVFIIFVFLNISNLSFAEDNFFEEGKIKYDEKSYEEAKFLFQRGIVFNPKDEKSYLYLAKIFSIEENKINDLKNFLISKFKNFLNQSYKLKHFTLYLYTF